MSLRSTYDFTVIIFTSCKITYFLLDTDIVFCISLSTKYRESLEISNGKLYN